jgi:hypothetical protein
MPRSRQSLLKQQEQELTAAYGRMDTLERRWFVICLELFLRDGIVGWVRMRTALDRGIQAHVAAVKKGKR